MEPAWDVFVDQLAPCRDVVHIGECVVISRFQKVFGVLTCRESESAFRVTCSEGGRYSAANTFCAGDNLLEKPFVVQLSTIQGDS